LKCSGEENLEQRRKTVSEEAERRDEREEKRMKRRERKRGKRKNMREEEGDDTWRREKGK